MIRPCTKIDNALAATRTLRFAEAVFRGRPPSRNGCREKIALLFFFNAYTERCVGLGETLGKKNEACVQKTQKMFDFGTYKIVQTARA